MELGHKRFTGRMSDNDLRLLRTFRTVVRHGGFVAAESELQIGLPSISRYMKDLEIRLGLRLCERGRRGFTLTAEGKQVHEACLELFSDIDDFEGKIRDIHANPGGALRVGLVDTLASDPHFRLSDAMRRYKATLPNIFFNIVTKTSNLIEQEIMDDTLDIGVVFERRRMDQFSYHPLYDETSYLYCSVDHPLWVEHGGRTEDVDLSVYEFVGYPMAHMMERMGVEGLFNRTATATNMETIAMLIDSDSFIGFLPEQYVGAHWCRDRFRPIAPKRFSYGSRISAITRAGAVSPLIGAFVDYLRPQDACVVEPLRRKA